MTVSIKRNVKQRLINKYGYWNVINGKFKIRYKKNIVECYINDTDFSISLDEFN